MSDIYTLVAKIQALPKRRIAEIEDFVDFLALRRSPRNAKSLRTIEEELHVSRAQSGLPPHKDRTER